MSPQFGFWLLAVSLLALATLPQLVRGEDEHWAVRGHEEQHEEHHEGEEEEWEYVDDDTVQSDDEEWEEDFYFYAHHDEPTLVQEFELPEGADPFSEYKMLWETPPPGVVRIVEFYAHWCPQ